MKRMLLAATAAWTMMPSLAMAQERESTNRREPDVILVTAERRAENVQDVPISIVALSGETLRERGVDNLADLSAEVPSFSFVDNGNTKYINIRGVGITESAPNQTVGVAVHLDGAYIARELTFHDAFFDVESVQVLRGPQGTYSGQNASGGAIFIESAKPKIGGEATGYAQATIGNFSRRQLEAAVSVPLSKTLAARFSGRVEDRDSFYTNLGPVAGPTPGGLATGIPVQPGDIGNFVGRAQLLWEPTDALQARLIHQFSRLTSDGTAFQNDTPANRANPFLLFYNVTPYSRNLTTYHRTTGVVRWDPTEAFRVNATLAYQKTDHLTGGDYDRTNILRDPSIVQAQGFTRLRDHSWAGEINLVSMGDGPFEWTVGATMLDYTQNGDVYSERGAQITTGLGRNFAIVSVRQNQAIFAEVGYKLTDTLQVKVGGRYNHEKNGFRSFINYPAGGLTNAGPSAPFPNSGRLVSSDILTGRVLVNWTPSPDHLIYATFSRGYKPGGVPAAGPAYGNEIVTNWEAGWKGDLLGNALQGSLSAFWMDYDGFQATVQPDPFDPTSRSTKNVDNTRIKGFEAQLSTNLGAFHADVGLSYLDTAYGAFTDTLPARAFGNASAVAVAVGGRQLNYAPKFSISGGISYEIEAGNEARVTPSIRFNHATKQWVSFFHLPYHRIDDRTLVDARLAIAPNDAWTITAYVTNLFDKTYVSNASQTNDGVGSYQLGAPREFGVTVAVNF